MKKLFFLLLCVSFPVLAIECPADKPVVYKGECLSCNSFFGVKDIEEAECIKCSNREYIDGKCVETKESLIKRIKKKCNCGEKEFIGYNLFYQACHCVKCSEEKNPVFGGGWYGLGTDEEECSKCANREYDGHMCFLKKCPEGKFKHKDGYCLRCGDPLDHESSKEECLLCSNREYSQNRCSLKECPKESFKNETGTCIPCSGDIFRETTDGGMAHFEAVRNYKSSKQECDKCPNRKYVGKECIFE